MDKPTQRNQLGSDLVPSSSPDIVTPISRMPFSERKYRLEQRDRRLDESRLVGMVGRALRTASVDKEHRLCSSNIFQP